MNSTYLTRSKSTLDKQSSKETRATQTDNSIASEVPVRIKGSSSETSTMIEPRYLEAMSVLMSDNMSASEAIKAVQIIDTKIDLGADKTFASTIGQAIYKVFS